MKQHKSQNNAANSLLLAALPSYRENKHKAIQSPSSFIFLSFFFNITIVVQKSSQPIRSSDRKIIVKQFIAMSESMIDIEKDIFVSLL